MNEAHADRETLVGLLRNLGTDQEVRYYLQQFSSLASQKFAVVKVGGGVVADQLGELADALALLHRLGLYPVVLHGGGPQLTAALDEAGIGTERVDGLRVTPPEALDVVRRTLQAVNFRLVEALEARGTRARPVTGGVFTARLLDPERLGLVGEAVSADTAPLDAAVRQGHVPVVSCLGETAGGQIVNVNADGAARALARAVSPFKIVFLTPTGGLLDPDDKLIASVNLAEDYEPLMNRPWVHSGMRTKLKEIKRLLDDLPAASSVSITSPDRLARELFTHRGAGTLVRAGEPVRRFGAFSEVDRERLRGLVEGCFGRTLAEDYFERKRCLCVYLTDSYRATAVLTEELGVPYLDKFAVTPQAQGEGIGGSLWARLTADWPRLVWRARADNPISAWYFERADGCVRSGLWTVFWRGLSGFDEVRRCVEHTLSLPATLTQHHAGEAP